MGDVEMIRYERRWPFALLASLLDGSRKGGVLGVGRSCWTSTLVVRMRDNCWIGFGSGSLACDAGRWTYGYTWGFCSFVEYCCIQLPFLSDNVMQVTLSISCDCQLTFTRHHVKHRAQWQSSSQS